MPIVTTGLFSLEDITRHSITDGYIEIEQNAELTFGTFNIWEEFEGVRLEDVKIAPDARALLLQSNLDIRQALGSAAENYTFYSRMVIDDEDWISPEITITIENMSTVYGSSQNTQETCTNLYLIMDLEDFLGETIDIKLEIMADSTTEEGELLEVDAVLSAAIFLR